MTPHSVYNDSDSDVILDVAASSSSSSTLLRSFLKSDESVYVLILVVSLLSGFFFRLLTPPPLRRLASTAFGLLLLLLCGVDAGYALFSGFVGAAIVRFAGRPRRNLLAFLFSFSFLAFFRCATHFRFPQPRPLANAVQLMLSLKIVAVAFEATDAENATEKLAELKASSTTEKSETATSSSSPATTSSSSSSSTTATTAETLRLSRLSSAFPSFADCLCYFFCYVGLFTGPFFKFRTWLDWTRNGSDTRHLSTRAFLLKRLAWIPILVVCHAAIKGFFPLSFASSTEFEKGSFWRRCFFMVPTFAIFRTRMYVAWLLAECVAIAAAFGAYPTQSQSRPGDGPQNLLALQREDGERRQRQQRDFDFEAIRNIDIIGVELKPTGRSAMRCWNMSVQYWLAHYVYKRFPYRRFGTLVTMLVSAFWHGFHAGYYLSFLTVPLVAAVDDAWDELLRKRLVQQQQQQQQQRRSSVRLYDFCNWFLRCRAYDYMCMGFLLLSYEATMAYWRSVRFILHFVYVFLLLLALGIRWSGVSRVTTTTTTATTTTALTKGEKKKKD